MLSILQQKGKTEVYSLYRTQTEKNFITNLLTSVLEISKTIEEGKKSSSAAAKCRAGHRSNSLFRLDKLLCSSSFLVLNRSYSPPACVSVIFHLFDTPVLPINIDYACKQHIFQKKDL